MELDKLIKNVHVVTPGSTFRGFIGIAQGKIEILGSGSFLPEAKEVIDGQENHVIPGVVDPEAHLASVKSYREDIETESRAAAAAGVTSWGLMQSSTIMGQPIGAEVSPEEVALYGDVFNVFKEMSEKYSMVDFFLTPKILKDAHAAEIPKLASEYGVTSFKIQLHLKTPEAVSKFWTTGKRQGYFGYDDGTVFLAFENVARLGRPAIVCLHCENWEISRILQDRLIKEGRKDFKAWNERSPHFSEAMHVRQYAYLARAVRCPIYIQHTTTEETMQEIVRARAEGGTVTSQTGHHYLSLPEDTWRINVPLRDAETIEKLWAGVKDGIIDCVGSDHVNRAKPRDQMEKPGDVWATESGFASRVEALLPVMLSEGVHKGRISLQRMVQVCCENTARSFGLFPQKGSISIGADADLVLVDVKKRVLLTRDMIHSRAGWSIYEGWDFNGWPILTMLRGEVVSRWNDAKRKTEIVGSPRGRYLPRKL